MAVGREASFVRPWEEPFPERAARRTSSGLWLCGERGGQTSEARTRGARARANLFGCGGDNDLASSDEFVVECYHGAEGFLTWKGAKRGRGGGIETVSARAYCSGKARRGGGYEPLLSSILQRRNLSVCPLQVQSCGRGSRAWRPCRVLSTAGSGRTRSHSHSDSPRRAVCASRNSFREAAR